MKKQLYIYIVLFLLFGLFSCENSDNKPKTFREIRAYEKPLENVNKFLLQKDKEEIVNMCKRKGWKMQMTKSGLWYGNIKPTDLDSVKKGDVVEIKYKIELLDGKVLYDSDSLGTKIFEVGHGAVENGLEEGILIMKDQERFRFIMPPHKAYGLLGDLKKIPARSTIIYYVEVINIQH